MDSKLVKRIETEEQLARRKRQNEERLLHSALEAEQAVLGSALIDAEIIGELLVVVEDKDFSNKNNRTIFQTIRFLYQSGTPVDAITVLNEVAKSGLIENGVLRSYIAQLMDMTPTSANWKEYAGIMRESSTVYSCWKICEMVHGASSVDELRPLIAQMVEIVGTGRGVKSFTAREMYENFLYRQEHKEESETMKFGFPSIDDMTYLPKGKVIIIGAEPDVGKTAFSLQVAYQMSAKYKVGYFTLETDWEDVTDRTISCAMEVSYSGIHKHSLSDEMWDRIALLGPQDYVKRNFRVISAAGYTPTKIQAVSQAYGFDVIFVDYVQKVKAETSVRASTVERLDSISIALKDFATLTGTQVVMTAQLTRPGDGAAWKEPGLRSIKGSSQFEQDADFIMMLYRPNPEFDENQQEHRLLRVVKNKGGESDVRFSVYFDGDHQRFSIMDTKREAG